MKPIRGWLLRPILKRLIVDLSLVRVKLWDQVAANLTTLGEMGGVKFKVVPADEAEVEEKIEEGKKVKKWLDDDGDGISYEKGEVDG